MFSIIHLSDVNYDKIVIYNNYSILMVKDWYQYSDYGNDN